MEQILYQENLTIKLQTEEICSFDVNGNGQEAQVPISTLSLMVLTMPQNMQNYLDNFRTMIIFSAGHNVFYMTSIPQTI